MVDKALFVGNSGAKEAMRELEIVTNNLANVTRTGFRADYQAKLAYHADHDEKGSRAYTMTGKSFSDFTPGPTVKTERDLDVALAGKGFIAIQNHSGHEAYTRDGSLQLVNGVLKTQTGQLVMGTSGAITVPDNAERMSIGNDGTISVKMKGESELVSVNKIKLVNPDIRKLSKAEDGLFVLGNGEASPQDDSVRINAGVLESSNVNAVETLTNLIELSRQFEMHSNLMKSIQEDDTKANEILALHS